MCQAKLYIRALIPLLTSLPVHHKRIKQMQLSEERREERLGMLFDEFGLKPRSGCWEKCHSEKETVAGTLTLNRVRRSLLLSVIFIRRKH